MTQTISIQVLCPTMLINRYFTHNLQLKTDWKASGQIILKCAVENNISKYHEIYELINISRRGKPESVEDIMDHYSLCLSSFVLFQFSQH